jgi:TolB-like protein/Tfp pilus assembly protein PilF
MPLPRRNKLTSEIHGQSRNALPTFLRQGRAITGTEAVAQIRPRLCQMLNCSVGDAWHQMSETRKLTTILAADIAGYSRLTAADEERTLARLRALRSDLVDPAISIHHGRVVKRTGDGMLVEFRSPVEAVRCAIEVQDGMVECNAGLPAERRIQFRVGIHVGDVVEETDGDLMGDAVNIAARIEGITKPGGIYVSRAAYDQIDGKIADRFTDLGERELKNISKAVRVFALTRSRELVKPADQSAPPRLSMLVLPFTNLGGDPEQEYFVDGVTESLTTDLSRIAGSFVIGRNTAFTYKGKAVDLKQIGRELNVRYVLGGSVQRGSNRLRVNVELADAETGNHLWAERFNTPVADLFDMQDEIVARLAGTFSAQLIDAEARRAERTPHPDSMDLYFRGIASINRGETPEYAAQAKEFFARALALDPGNVEALVGNAFVDSVVGSHMFSTDRAERLAAAEAAATKALSLAPNHAWAHMVLGNVLIFTNRPSQGIAQCERALELDRNLAMAHAYIGHAKMSIGRAEETDAYVVEALRLSPRDPTAYVWMAGAGVAKLFVGADEAAEAWLRRAIDNNRNQAIAHFWLAAALAFLGRIDEARAATQAGLALDPAFTVARFRSAPATDNPVYLRQRERVCDGMRKAGVPNA